MSLKLAIIGYGVMGHLVDHLGRSQGHEIVATFNSDDASGNFDSRVTSLSGCDVAIDFSVASAVRENIKACIAAKIPLVEGTTGWSAEGQEVFKLVRDGQGAFVYGANFSIGVNLFYRLTERAAELVNKFDNYEPFIEEAHHSRKRDAPSGTALKLSSILEGKVKTPISITSTRAGNIPGTHRVGFDSAADQILLTHMARSREGFASGALLAAKWLRANYENGQRGVYEFSAVFDDLLK
ncbi:MAG: 4-hydroxy-tetrahydrodipicolinate reductase [Pyrinomonadaceae bacterium]